MKKQLLKSVLCLTALCLTALSSIAQEGVFDVPYRFDSTRADDVPYFKVVDANGDGITWQYDYYFINNDEYWNWQYNTFKAETDGDEWLFSPGIRMEQGYFYNVTVSAATFASSRPDQMEVWVGNGQDVEQMQQVLMPLHVYATGQDEPITVAFIPQESGVYHLGFHALSTTSAYKLTLNSWEVSEGITTAVPSPAASVEVTPGEKGARQATIAFDAPSEDMGGHELTSLTKAIVTNLTTGNEVAVVENPVPGERCEVVDDGPKKNRVNRYSVSFENERGASLTTEGEAYIGFGIPEPPRNVRWHQEGMDVVIEWEAPGSVGTKGGYVDSTAVKYIIMQLEPERMVAEYVDGFSFTDTGLQDTEGQIFLYYGVFAINDVGYSGRETQAGPFGVAYDAPFAESFAKGDMTAGLWLLEHNDTDWDSDATWKLAYFGTNPELQPQDGDNGMLIFHPNQKGDISMVSGRISLEGLDRPECRFWASVPANTLELMASLDDNHWDTLLHLEGQAEASGQWTEYVADLSAYEGQTVILAWRGISKGEELQIAVDNIRVQSGIATGIGQTHGLDGLQVRTQEGQLAIMNATGLVEVCDVQGKTLFRGQADGSLRLTAQPGIYIVRQADEVRKVLVK